MNQLALTAADGEGRRLVAVWMQELGLRATVDRLGNSVPTAGMFEPMTFASPLLPRVT